MGEIKIPDMGNKFPPLQKKCELHCAPMAPVWFACRTALLCLLFSWLIGQVGFHHVLQHSESLMIASKPHRSILTVRTFNNFLTFPPLEPLLFLSQPIQLILQDILVLACLKMAPKLAS